MSHKNKKKSVIGIIIPKFMDLASFRLAFEVVNQVMELDYEYCGEKDYEKHDLGIAHHGFGIFLESLDIEPKKKLCYSFKDPRYYWYNELFWNNVSEKMNK